MLQTRTGIEYRAGTAAAILPTIGGVGRFADESNQGRSRLDAEQALDEVLADSFPASDPPSWNPGIARPKPHGEYFKAVADPSARTGASSRIDLSRLSGADRTLIQGTVALAGAAGIVLLVPFAILLVGLPVALAIRGLLGAIGWLFGVASQ